VLREFAKDKQLKELEARVIAVVADEAGSIGDRHILPVILKVVRCIGTAALEAPQAP
jgi:hypothetical protein